MPRDMTLNIGVQREASLSLSYAQLWVHLEPLSIMYRARKLAYRLELAESAFYLFRFTLTYFICALGLYCAFEDGHLRT